MPSPPAPAANDAERLGVGGLVRAREFRRLLTVRFATQWADGLFQAALGGALLFNPERHADPLAVAAGFAVMLLPYSMVGPFAGALLDRWDRRRVLMTANLLRAVLVLVAAAAMYAGVAGTPLYVAALAVAGVSRFLLSGLSAALPHVVEHRHLVEANTVAVTAGAALSVLGAACAIGLRELVGPDDTGSALVTTAAVAGSLLAAALAAGFARGLLGPTDPGPDDSTDRPDDPAGGAHTPADRRHTVIAVTRGLSDGARATVAAPTAAASFTALVAHRLSFGVTTLLTLLLFRYAFADSGILRAGLAGIGQTVMLAGAGLVTAAVLAPWMVRRIGRPRTTRCALLVAATTQLALAAVLTLPAVYVAAFVLGLAGQVVKLCADAGVQAEVDDDRRGRVFALYDAAFNLCYVLAVTAAALLAPADGRAPWLLVAAAGVYLLGLLAHDAALRQSPTRRGRIRTA